ncbi:DUF2271 domain-containing protein, partial [Bacteroidales bacterium OttesenSCG-928-L03]|nr:DUF2271 domain-containing protein [Bacteroidales bacterium OttesenSCG-928-L03]
MKQKLLVVACLLAFITIGCSKGTETLYGKAILKVNVDYEKQPGPGSNQWAIWIEDEAGNLIKTLFVTSFTADGGYTFRANSLPIWVAKANPSEHNGETIDAYSGATPQTGIHSYVWDLTDEDGTPVANGTYRFVFEATLFGDSEVIYQADFLVEDKAASIKAEPKFTSENEKNKDMIRGVTAQFELVP